MQKGSKQYFGTDGIRGLANQGPLDVAEVLRLGEITAEVLSAQFKRRVHIGLGWDTRISSPALAAALSAGLASGNAHVMRFGVIPTPAVSQLTRHYKLDAGIVISASHNAAEDNGIKYFAATGGKFPEKSEAVLEKKLHAARRNHPQTGIQIGTIVDCFGEAARVYTRDLIKRFVDRKLKGLKVAADLANGATCRTVPPVFDALGIKATYLHDQPDGININHHCGSCHLESVIRKVRSGGFQAGLAFDGDGDRVMLIDEKGGVVNGDRILGILAMHYARKGQLAKRTVVSTVMSNLGLELYLKEKKIHLLRTTVGDRYVSQAMEKKGLVLGGEQSGHILLPRLSQTGDGLLTALEVLDVMKATNRPLSALAGGWRDFPQLLVNIPVKRRPDLMKIKQVSDEVKASKKALKDRGRVNLRYSGTEALARVMVEAETGEQAELWAHRIGDAVAAKIGHGKRRIITWLTSV
ncbi:phosphoglucosamine mutase [bacterium]|nr:phosphoglucosamine mutase [bacterium]